MLIVFWASRFECWNVNAKEREKALLPVASDSGWNSVPLVMKSKHLLTKVYIENLGVASAVNVWQTPNFKK